MHQQFISIGCACPSAFAIKNTSLRCCSYPFDWLLITPIQIRECLSSDFKEFLDISRYYHDTEKKCKNIKKKASCHHVIFGKEFFRHHCPLCFESHYEYIVRSVVRFRNICKNIEVEKVFVYMNIWNPNSVNDSNINIIYNALSEYVNGPWKLLYLECYGGKHLRKCEIIRNDSENGFYHYIIHGKSDNIGVRYKDDLDNQMVSTVLRMHHSGNILISKINTSITNQYKQIWPYYMWSKSK